MTYRIVSIKPFLPAGVGEKSYEFRVELKTAASDEEIGVLVSADELGDYRRFQQTALRQLGLLVTFEFDEPANEITLHWRWQQLLTAANWEREADTELRTAAGEPVIENTSDDDGEELKFAD